MGTISKLRAGDRLRAIRELTGLSQREFADLLGVDLMPMKNAEYKKNRVTEECYEAMGKNFPELLKWFVYEGPINLQELRNSDSKYCKFIAARFDAGLVPEEYFPEDLIRDND
ncbi:helix-turn-helix transcriptional regulator [uncultured Microbulbifer sp.]|uniref:helix-turn-helix domain-containing protein n=1 Tax=uncultured Microbulbifer sp. TaxID=348147 RepID=UPI002627B2BA|nr:helix-turn-helix transcriptional regulator [uncultured Microbulbifer sp.]